MLIAQEDIIYLNAKTEASFCSVQEGLPNVLFIIQVLQ